MHGPLLTSSITYTKWGLGWTEEIQSSTSAIRLFYSSVLLQHHTTTGVHGLTATVCQVPLQALTYISSCGFHNHLRRHGPLLSTSDMLMPDSLRPHGLKPARLLCPWEFSGKNIGVGCHFLLQEIFPTQGLSPYLQHLLPCQMDSLPLYHLGRPLLQRGDNLKKSLIVSKLLKGKTGFESRQPGCHICAFKHQAVLPLQQTWGGLAPGPKERG